MKISSFRELRVYRCGLDLQQEIFALSKAFPPEERYSLTDQVRRSSRSVGANIAEAWQKRRYLAHFISKLTDADGEQGETQHWIDTAAACGYLKPSESARLLEQCFHVGSMLGTMIATPEKFCHKPE
jgi:four helix bundle protein